jgi:hypothetical protein
MNQLKLVSISEVKTEKARVDEKVSRQYYTATFSNPANPFGRTVSRTFWQQHNADGTQATWKGANPSEVKQFIGKLIPGRIVSSKVEAYDITDSLGNIREASTYTAVVLDGETPEAVFKASGKVIVEAAPAVAMIAAEEDARPF